MRTLLIADDERTIREGIAGAINWASIGISRVLQASDGREAKDLIQSERPDIAIVDIIMPEMTGIELISYYRKRGDGPEFVIISGYGEFDYAQEAIRNHVYHYLLKPCDIDEISVTVENIVNKLDHDQRLETERRQMREHISMLIPQAREQIFRDFISGSRISPDNWQLLRQFFRQGGGAYRLLVFSPEEAENYPRLILLRNCIESSTAAW